MDRTRRRIASLLLGLLSLFFAGCALAAPAKGLDLSGIHSFVIDDKAFIPGKLDTPIEWQEMSVPGSWRSQGVTNAAMSGWHRITFSIPDGTDFKHPTLDLGVVLKADETYLNGRRIGGEGYIGAPQSGLYNHPPTLPRYYLFDRDLLNFNAPNILDIRLARIPHVDDAGILGPQVRLVEYSDGLTDFSKRMQVFAAVDYFLLGMEFIILLFILFAFFIGVRDRTFLWFCILYGAFFISNLEQRHISHAFGVDHPAWELLAAKIGGFTLIPFIEFGASMFSKRVGFFGRLLQLGTLATLLSVPMPADTWLGWWNNNTALGWQILFPLSFLLVLYWTVKALLAKHPNALPLLLGVIAAFASLVADQMLPLNFTETLIGAQNADFGISFFLICLTFAIGQRLFQTEHALKVANANALNAHEDERQRLARDIHDGVGQWLSTIKLNLQMLRREMPQQQTDSNSRMEDLVTDVSNAIEDTRRIAHDLSPAFLDDLGLAAAMQSHADRISNHYKIAVHIEVGETDNLPEPVRNHLYRIFQEGLKNAIKHSGCDRVEVQLDVSNQTVSLHIADNGSGLNSQHMDKSRFHMGFRAMQERANLLNGVCKIGPSVSGGTLVEVKIPLRGEVDPRKR